MTVLEIGNDKVEYTVESENLSKFTHELMELNKEVTELSTYRNKKELTVEECKSALKLMNLEIENEMTRLLKVQNKEVKLPYNIKMLYVVTVYLPNGETGEPYSFSSYEGARNNYIDLVQLGNPVELTCNVEVYENEEYSKTEYVSIAKNFEELG